MFYPNSIAYKLLIFNELYFCHVLKDMGRINKGPNGGFSGMAGSMIGSSWRDRLVNAVILMRLP